MSNHQDAPDTTRDILDLIPTLRLMARGLVRGGDGADDLVQETLLRALAHVGGFTPGTDLRAWLFTIMRNVFRAQGRRRASEWRGRTEGPPPAAVFLPVHDDRIICARLMQAIGHLPMPYREALVLVALMDQSYADAARVCNCPIGTIKSRISRARAMILAEMGAASFAELMAPPR
ncbi:sigma-70 family RNA polymerase sigma factor [Ruixingdingia sedimenti]|uniref:RNA polymerase sigma factor n=1 Tax=Ruixingdingia sedimenti TaxID=3073604 RepID=A0ABU1F9K5_9RHOB|nr:sigma-70 family RNA polymerase sigma factor [Xinfangfangia sp. LG-4]MDR5653546.1 sigma-70 family RNA polymerase sigma factor [Xinfangfangia sp. LG-4]